VFATGVPVSAADPAEIGAFYRAVAGVSFTLLGLWWVVANARYARGEGDARLRRHAYGITLYFLLPGLMSLISSINSELSLLWRLAFGVCAALGIVEVVLYLRTGGARTAGAVALRVCGLAAYALIAAVAIRPELPVDLGLGLAPREVEAILLSLILFVGAHLAWLALTEPSETAGA
jgi:hypothetical protein